ncbi:hypothetical protein [Streptomyces abikoensis]|uniref:Uncharacterized protein n=1 Tax=Streptomyces abikoensis TaxID=97398 RepID=A0ABW7TAR0_9ACTN
MSGSQTVSDSMGSIPADPAGAIRAEVEREYAAKLAISELKAQAARDGAKVSDAFFDYVDPSKLLGEDGWPSAEVIKRALEPYQPTPASEFPRLMGAGYHRGGSFPAAPQISLDVRKR